MSGGRYSLRMLIGTIIIGFVYSIIGEIFYRNAIDKIPRILLVSIYFLGLFLVLGLGVYLIGKGIACRVCSSINKKQWFVVCVLMIILSLLFEFLYEMVRKKEEEHEITSYLFILDDSGSMLENDPTNIRYQVVDMLLNDKPETFSYGIYSFSDTSMVLRPMMPKSKSVSYVVPEAYGGTAIKGALSEIRDDMKSGALSIDDNCKVILLSDGYATDIAFFYKKAITKVLEDFSERGICISTVGFKNADESLMRLIADKTGGVYVQASDVNELKDAMNVAAVNTNAGRNLLGYRSGSSFNLLLGLMRIVFIAMLGIIISLEKANLCERFLDTKTVFISSVIGSILAGVCIEIGMNSLGIHPVIMRGLTCILISFTLLKKDLNVIDGENSGVKYSGK